MRLSKLDYEKLEPETQEKINQIRRENTGIIAKMISIGLVIELGVVALFNLTTDTTTDLVNKNTNLNDKKENLTALEVSILDDYADSLDFQITYADEENRLNRLYDNGRISQDEMEKQLDEFKSPAVIKRYLKGETKTQVNELDKEIRNLDETISLNHTRIGALRLASVASAIVALGGVVLTGKGVLLANAEKNEKLDNQMFFDEQRKKAKAHKKRNV